MTNKARTCDDALDNLNTYASPSQLCTAECALLRSSVRRRTAR